MPTFNNDGGMDDGIQGSTESHDKNGVIGINNDTTERNALTPEGNGVMGSTKVPDGAGVFGLHDSGGVGVAGFGHPVGIGVVGISAPEGAKGGDGVFALTNSEHRNGVVGVNDSTTARATDAPGGNGMFGFTKVPDGAGVFGAHASTGIGVAGLGLIGVSGGSVNGFGVVGVSAPAGAKGGDGVHGLTNSELRNGVYGLNVSTTARNNNELAGNGVSGFTTVPDGAGVLGAHSGGGNGLLGLGNHGVIGTGSFGVTGTGTQIGVWGIAKDQGWAGYFSGPVRFEGDVEVGGNIIVTGDVQLANGDCAEEFDIAEPESIEPGTVMVLGRDGSLHQSHQAYDKRVAGVISGAGDYKAGIVLDKRQTRDNRQPVALLGKVFCKVDASYGPIEVGDLLTTSESPGHAMKATDPLKAFGSIIGKALRPFNEGQGFVPILVALQ